jgi:hypothetical protein
MVRLESVLETLQDILSLWLSPNSSFSSFCRHVKGKPNLSHNVHSKKSVEPIAKQVQGSLRSIEGQEMKSGMRGFRMQSMDGMSMRGVPKTSVGNMTGDGQLLKKEWEEVAKFMGMGSGRSGQQSAGMNASLSGGSNHSSTPRAGINDGKSSDSSSRTCGKKCNFATEIFDRYDICNA